MNIAEKLTGQSTREFFKCVEQNKNISAFGLGAGERFFLSSLISRPLVYVVSDEKECERVTERLKGLGRDVVSLCMPIQDYTFHMMEFGLFQRERQLALFKLVQGTCDLVVTGSVLSDPFPVAEMFTASVITLKKDQDLEPDQFISRLISAGYTRTQSVQAAGHFARRGDVVDVFPLNSELPVRIHFFDTVVEKITTFNLLSQYSVDELDGVVLCPNGYVVDEQTRQKAVQQVEACAAKALKSAEKSPNAYDVMQNIQQAYTVKNALECGVNLSAWGYLSPFLPHGNILEYVAENSVVIIDQPKLVYGEMFKTAEAINESITDAVSGGRLFHAHQGVRADFETVRAKLANFELISFQSVMTQNKFFAPKQVISFHTAPVINTQGNIELALPDIRRYLCENYQIILAAHNSTDAVSLSKRLDKENIPNEIVAELAHSRPSMVAIAQTKIKDSVMLIDDKFVLFGLEQLGARHQKIHKSTQVKPIKITDEFTLPKVGEYVVHSVHGIGICEGVTKLEVNGHSRDYLIISYKNNDKLYVPTEQMDMLGRYVGAEKSVELSVLGGAQFEKVKSRVRESIKELAFDLLALYRERENLQGIPMRVSPDLEDELERGFPYKLTVDQQSAINDVKRDLASGKIMDRLIVGDVGYGKTEVAIRAAFLAVMSGKQMAILTPTTILSEQHYNTFLSRFKGFGINVACLNRFRTKKEQASIIEDLKQGKLNIVCGTHRLLSKDVGFFDLGLLVLDEEQRFGVGDKEKIKNLKRNVHVLTLTATPIPRTLHMSLAGIRDISTIETPPLDRLPVQTMVAQYSESLLKSAISREISRGGQVLVVYPRVETIEEFGVKLRTLIGDVKLGIAHGQMDKRKLEEVMLGVYKNEVQVLIATTLIENGIDLPNANTLFVVRADLLGLSQLYQLRGRVGRSDRLAWAYFTYMEEAALSSQAFGRLTALLEFSALGSGFKIAMRDLEIRGAGNILGPEQHGQMEKVGYDMYCKLLNTEVQRLRGEPIKEYKPVKIEVELDAFIPEDFTDSMEERMELYSVIAGIHNDTDRDNTLKLIEERWGSMPQPIKGLCNVALLKSKCESVGVERVIITSKKLALYWDVGNENAEKAVILAGRASARVYKRDNWVIIEPESRQSHMTARWDSAVSFIEKLI